MAQFIHIVIAVAVILSFMDGISTKGCRTLSVGESCHRSSPINCASGLHCEEDVCKIENNGDCTDNADLCVFDKACVGQSTTKKCKKLRGPGKRCLTDPFWFCEKDLLCENSVCKIPNNGSCTDHADQCAKGLTCVGSAKKKNCRVLRKAGELCDPEKDLCEQGMVCRGLFATKQCLPRVPLGETCGADLDACEIGLVCRGTSTNFRTCKIAQGESCAGAPARSCESRTYCIDNVCTRPAQVPVNGLCEMDGFEDDCDEGLTCDGVHCKVPESYPCDWAPENSCMGSTVCANNSCQFEGPVHVGWRCGTHRHDYCSYNNLGCDDHQCKLLPGEACESTDPANSCVSGTSCVQMSDGSSFCVWECGSTDTENCDRGLVCEGNRCEIPRWGECTNNTNSCVDGLNCVGRRETKRCNRLVGLGDLCHTDPFVICRKGLICEDHVCKIPAGGVCTDNPSGCYSRAVCVGSEKLKKCLWPRDVGQTCDHALVACQAPFACDKSDMLCKIPRGGDCRSFTARHCTSGTKCVGFRIKTCENA